MLPRRLLLSGLAGIGVRPWPAAARPLAPEFVDIGEWVNAATPLSMAGLRGRVVLVNFWTYSCINCRRTVPYLNRWQAEYGSRGLQVIGIHTPEFGFERVRRNVEQSVREFGIRYPVGPDNAFATWRAWGTRAWPTFQLLDRDGRVVLVREGEGYAREMEAAIRALLGLLPNGAGYPGDDPDLSRIGTPEIYFGALHRTSQDRAQDRAQTPRQGEATYAFGERGPGPNEYQLDGTWLRDGEALVLRSASGGVHVRFSAAKLHLVASAPGVASLRVSVDGGTPAIIQVERPTLYTLLDGDAYRQHMLTLQADTPGLSLFSATFG